MEFEYFPEDILVDDPDYQECAHGEAFLPDCETCIRWLVAERRFVRTIPISEKPKHRCYLHKGRIGRYSHNVSRDNPLFGKSFCKTCYREAIRNEEIPIPTIQFMDLESVIIKTVPCTENRLGLTPEKIRSLIVEQWVRLSNQPTQIIQLSHNRDNGVTVLDKDGIGRSITFEESKKTN